MSAPSRSPHPAIVEAREVIAVEQAILDAPLRRLERAVMLAPTIDICEALLRGERVPLGLLDQHYVRKYQIRRTA